MDRDPPPARRGVRPAGGRANARDLTGIRWTAAVRVWMMWPAISGAALAYSAEHDPHTALCLASRLPRWWRFRGRDSQGGNGATAARTIRARPMPTTCAHLGSSSGCSAGPPSTAPESRSCTGPSSPWSSSARRRRDRRAGSTRTLLWLHPSGTGDYAEARHHGRAGVGARHEDRPRAGYGCGAKQPDLARHARG